MSKKTDPNIKVVTDMALGAAKRQQLVWEQDTPKPSTQPKAKAKAQATSQTQLAIVKKLKPGANKQQMLRATGVEINPAATTHTIEEIEQQEEAQEATPDDWMEAEVVVGVADVPNTTLDDIENASSGIMFVDKPTLAILKAEGLDAKIAVLTPAHAGTPKDKVLRIPAKLKSSAVEVRSCEVYNFGSEENQVKLKPFMQISLGENTENTGIPTTCVVYWPKEATTQAIQKEWPMDDGKKNKDNNQATWAKSYVADARTALELSMQEFENIGFTNDQIHSTVIVEAANIAELQFKSGKKVSA